MAEADDKARRLAEARAELARAAAAPEEGRAEPVTVEAAKGRIRVTLGADGRVAEIFADPKAFKEGTDYIAEHVLIAVNEALGKRAAMVTAADAVPDLDAINESLAAVQDAGVRQLQAFSASISQVMAKLGRNG